MNELPDLTTFSERMQALVARVASCGVAPSDIQILPVTKAFGPEAVTLALDAGCGAVGENYAQELVRKHASLEQRQPQWHFIGRLQSNKVRKLASIVDLWQSLDRASVIDEVAKRAPGANVLVQVAISREPQKGGVLPEDAAALVEYARTAGLFVQGLMGVAGMDNDVAVAGQFKLLRALVDEQGLELCSMGMTNDLELAVKEGSTMLRIGTALFGPRTPKLGLQH
ncbi:MAG: YggS family pyridoxal phosphate-dependent enzyme [Acidimicrobiales bacterium]